jgi:hypothetical protein
MIDARVFFSSGGCMGWTLRVLAVACLACLGFGHVARASSAAPPDDPAAGLAALQGSWVLDPDRSDEPPDPLKQAAPKRRTIFGPGPPGPLTGPGMGGPITGGGRNTDPDPEDVHRLRQLSDLAFDDADGLEIVVSGSLVTVTDGAQMQRLTADGQKHQEVTAFGLQLERKTKWDDGRLVTEVKVKGGGGKSKQTWTPEGDRLIIATEIEVDHTPGPVKMRRVFDRSATR